MPASEALVAVEAMTGTLAKRQVTTYNSLALNVAADARAEGMAVNKKLREELQLAEKEVNTWQKNAPFAGSTAGSVFNEGASTVSGDSSFHRVPCPSGPVWQWHDCGVTRET